MRTSTCGATRSSCGVTQSAARLGRLTARREEAPAAGAGLDEWRREWCAQSLARRVAAARSESQRRVGRCCVSWQASPAGLGGARRAMAPAARDGRGRWRRARLPTASGGDGSSGTTSFSRLLSWMFLLRAYARLPSTATPRSSAMRRQSRRPYTTDNDSRLYFAHWAKWHSKTSSRAASSA